jgi:PAS domain S-box-containing protein
MPSWLRGFRRRAAYALVSINHEGRVNSWDDGAIKLFGWAYSEAIGRRLSDFLLPPAYRQSHERALQRLREDGPESGLLLGKELYTMALHRDGHQLSIRMLINRLAGRNGNAYYLATIARASNEFVVLGPEGPITSPAASEAELFRRRSEQLMELLADATSDLLARRPPSGD